MEGWRLALLTVLWALPFPTTIIVALRLAAWYFRPRTPLTDKTYTRRSYERISTVMIVLALVISLVNTALCLESAKYGLGEFDVVHNDQERVMAMRFLFVSQAFGIVGAELARISVAFYELHLFDSPVNVTDKKRSWLQRQLRNHRAILWANIVVQVVANGIALVQVYIQCIPMDKRWDLDDPEHCMDPHVHVDFGYAQGAINTCTVLCLSLIPAFKIFHLRVSVFHRICISILLGVGVIDAASSIVKTALLGRLAADEDLLYRISPLVVTWTFEQYVAIMCGSVPYLPQLIRRWHRKERRPRPSSQTWLEGGCDFDRPKYSLDRLLTGDSGRTRSTRGRAGTGQTVSTEGGGIVTKLPVMRNPARSSSTVNYNRFVV
ncbi:hypothetical protein MMC30_007673 [Trapelia coarctata]|nr:hypothetical protein [Trapelia coarctata]